jgi:hypothetical protein
LKGTRLLKELSDIMAVAAQDAPVLGTLANQVAGTTSTSNTPTLALGG